GDAVAADALALAFEQGPTTAGVAAGRAPSARPCRRRRHRPQVPDDRRDLTLREAARRHRRARNAPHDHADQLIVGRRAPELTGAEVPPGDPVAFRAVTAGAIGLIQAATVLDLAGKIRPLLRRHDD